MLNLERTTFSWIWNCLAHPPPPFPTPHSYTTVERIFSLKPLPQPLWKFQFHFWDPALNYYNGFKSLKWSYTYALLYSFCLHSNSLANFTKFWQVIVFWWTSEITSNNPPPPYNPQSNYLYWTAKREWNALECYREGVLIEPIQIFVWP